MRPMRPNRYITFSRNACENCEQQLLSMFREHSLLIECWDFRAHIEIVRAKLVQKDWIFG